MGARFTIHRAYQKPRLHSRLERAVSKTQRSVGAFVGLVADFHAEEPMKCFSSVHSICKISYFVFACLPLYLLSPCNFCIFMWGLLSCSPCIRAAYVAHDFHCP